MTLETYQDIPDEPYAGIVPEVPKSFLEELKRLDPELDCAFSRKYHRFVIYQEGKISGRVPVAIVNGYIEEDGTTTYRYPDQRDIVNLYMADLHRSGQEIKDRIVEGEEYMLGHQEKSMKDAEDAIKHQTKEDKHQLMRGYAETYNLGKYNSTYRRVETRRKGKLIKRDGYTVNDRRLGVQ